MVNFEIRAMATGDVGLIFNSWLRSFRKSQDMEHKAYFLFQHRLIEEILRRSNVLLAVSEDDPDQIFGWVCFEDREEGFTIHYVYVKATFRKLGIGRALVDSLPEAEWFTHKTYGSAFFGADYNPYLVR